MCNKQLFLSEARRLSDGSVFQSKSKPTRRPSVTHVDTVKVQKKWIPFTTMRIKSAVVETTIIIGSPEGGNSRVCDERHKVKRQN